MKVNLAFSAPGEGLIFAAGIWDEWVNRSTGEVIQSFAIITHEPPPFIADTGHDRCPVFLGESDGAKWLDGEGGEVPALKKLLLDSNQALAFQAEKHRPMKAGWEKRK